MQQPGRYKHLAEKSSVLRNDKINSFLCSVLHAFCFLYRFCAVSGGF